MKIVLLIPTNKQDVLFDYALSFDGLRSMSELFERHECIFSLSLQPPFTEQDVVDIQRRCREAGAKASCVFVAQESPPRMSFLRQSAANLHPDADFFVWWDDNMMGTFGTDMYPRWTGARMLEAFNYLERFPRCGILNMEGPRGGNYSEWKIKPSNARWWTSRGLIYRNAFSGSLYHDGAMEVKGAFDDVMPGFKLVEAGYYCAKQFNNPTRHCLRTNIGKEMSPRDFGMHDQALNRSQGEAFLANYYDEIGWTHLEKVPGTSSGFKPPVRLLEAYYKNGGERGIYPKMIRDDLTVDYA